ncbi:hypothetical protein TNIN_29491 [Trichonephila inaurata madagascariensis]|uniref:Uncharacterized protein n=1 Tax=Trichonephila inaurata madagascariensis TaxID=2747483 RepID=A0A8X6Y125_9ARAC|nr:hypothetical protein TNIN_29491 [Trichonephila inaurata madagascariensis]
MTPTRLLYFIRRFHKRLELWIVEPIWWTTPNFHPRLPSPQEGIKPTCSAHRNFNFRFDMRATRIGPILFTVSEMVP